MDASLGGEGTQGGAPGRCGSQLGGRSWQARPPLASQVCNGLEGHHSGQVVLLKLHGAQAALLDLYKTCNRHGSEGSLSPSHSRPTHRSWLGQRDPENLIRGQPVHWQQYASRCGGHKPDPSVFPLRFGPGAAVFALWNPQCSGGEREAPHQPQSQPKHFGAAGDSRLRGADQPRDTGSSFTPPSLMSSRWFLERGLLGTRGRKGALSIVPPQQPPNEPVNSNPSKSSPQRKRTKV